MKTIKAIWAWVVLWFWTAQTEKPERIPPPKIKATEVSHAYVVIKYHGQRINMLKTEFTIWQTMNRKDKRAMANKFARMEKEGKIRFEEVNGKVIAIKNKDYEKQAKQKA